MQVSNQSILANRFPKNQEITGQIMSVYKHDECEDNLQNSM